MKLSKERRIFLITLSLGALFSAGLTALLAESKPVTVPFSVLSDSEAPAIQGQSFMVTKGDLLTFFFIFGSSVSIGYPLALSTIKR